MITKDMLTGFPSTFGIYLFKKGDEILYVGKSVNLKARLLSHYENAKIDRKESLIIGNSEKVEIIVTDNEFKALLLESELIKKYHPKYNVIWKDNKSYLYIKITVKEKFPKVLLCRRENDGKSRYFGPFSSVRVAAELLSDIRRVVPFCTQHKMSKNRCFYSKIGLCDPCPNYVQNLTGEEYEMEHKRYRKNISRVTGILKGEVKGLVSEFYSQIKKLVSEEKYEEAIKIRNKIFRLEKLTHFFIYKNDLPAGKPGDYNLELYGLFKDFYPGLRKFKRIEAYDISNLGMREQTASMVVTTDGRIDKSQYRRFKIKSKKNSSDFERLTDVIKRRFSHTWPVPSLIVVDGGTPQVKTVKSVLAEIKKDIPLIGIAKNPDRLVIGTGKFPTIRPRIDNPGFNLIRLMRDESHRFARKYHLLLRGKDFLI